MCTRSYECIGEFPTKVIVVHHGVGASETWALLGEMVAELQQRGVFLQHACYLHLHLIA